MTVRIISTNQLLLPAHASVRRHPPTPESLRGPDYLDLFDAETVFCDVFQSGRDIVMVGPPLLNLEPLFTAATYSLDGETVKGFSTVPLDRAHRSRLVEAGAADTLSVDYGVARATVRVGADLNHLAQGRRVLLAMQRNNPIAWLGEWARLYEANNGVDAVVLYDMMSTEYSQDDLAGALKAVPGICVVIVVSWPFKYGVQPLDRLAGPWDSDFGQYVAWEHARRRFLMLAEAVTVSDVDEIFLAEDGRTIFEHAHASESGIVRFKQHDILPFVEREPTASRGISYADYYFYDPSAPLTTPKYAAIIDRLSDEHQLLVHSVARDYSPETDAIRGRQFLPMKLNWLKGSFDRIHPDRSGPCQHCMKDRRMIEAYDRARHAVSRPAAPSGTE